MRSTGPGEAFVSHCLFSSVPTEAEEAGEKDVDHDDDAADECDDTPMRVPLMMCCKIVFSSKTSSLTSTRGDSSTSKI